MKILVDTREQTPWSFPKTEQVERAGLTTGDYSLAGLEGLVAIERKSLEDFVSCCGKGRERWKPTTHFESLVC